jgi:hypothetical protein
MRGTLSQFADSFSQNVGYFRWVTPEDIFIFPCYIFIINLYVLHIAAMVILQFEKQGSCAFFNSGPELFGSTH